MTRVFYNLQRLRRLAASITDKRNSDKNGVRYKVIVLETNEYFESQLNDATYISIYVPYSQYNYISIYICTV